MESIFDLEHPYKTYFKMTLPSVLVGHVVEAAEKALG